MSNPIPVCHRCGALLESELLAAEAALAEAQFNLNFEKSHHELTLLRLDAAKQQVTQQAATISQLQEALEVAKNLAEAQLVEIERLKAKVGILEGKLNHQMMTRAYRPDMEDRS